VRISCCTPKTCAATAVSVATIAPARASRTVPSIVLLLFRWLLLDRLRRGDSVRRRPQRILNHDRLFRHDALRGAHQTGCDAHRIRADLRVGSNSLRKRLYGRRQFLEGFLQLGRWLELHRVLNCARPRRTGRLARRLLRSRRGRRYGCKENQKKSDTFDHLYRTRFIEDSQPPHNPYPALKERVSLDGGASKSGSGIDMSAYVLELRNATKKATPWSSMDLN
jgi:hypothetical protein